MHATITSQTEAGVTPAYNLQTSRIRSHHSTASARQAGWHEDVTPRREGRHVTAAMMSNDEHASESRPRGHERWARVQMRGVRVLSTRPAPLTPPRAQQWQPRMALRRLRQPRTVEWQPWPNRGAGVARACGAGIACERPLVVEVAKIARNDRVEGWALG